MTSIRVIKKRLQKHTNDDTKWDAKWLQGDTNWQHTEDEEKQNNYKETQNDSIWTQGYKDKQTDCEEMQNNQKTDKMRYKKGHKMRQKMRGSCAKWLRKCAK